MQAKAPETKHFGKEAFEDQEGTSIRWLGNAGAMINCRGTVIMVDPVLSGFDMPLLIDMPILEEQVPALDGILVTHCDNDHYSRQTCERLKKVTKEFHSTQYVSKLMKEEQGIAGTGHNIGEKFAVGDITVTLTPVDHAWQNAFPESHTREFQPEDYCGFWMDTPDGSVWAVGDSRLLESQLHMPAPDAMLFDFSDSDWHIGLDGAKKMAAAYPDTPLILWHWGSVDAPEWKEFNGDPQVLRSMIVNPDRIVVLAPGEEYRVCKKGKR
ncbi:MAG: MBL fold metallo-hydrolase [Clostridia bacterium]|nr:MBL fold metallo-hydrolase [Clostridia bacterium]